MSKNLVIVESPAKAKTIEKYLGKDFLVRASIGHIKDLPKKNLGVDLQNNFEPEYEVIGGKKKVIDEIKKLAQASEFVYLASDPDREGEAIAWHVAEEIRKLKRKPVIHRVLFNEITKAAIKEAIKKPIELNMNMFEAQQARRILDRLVGYQISPLLWEKVRRGLSAGRVQSVAVRLVCEREDEISKFISEEYWNLEVKVEGSIPPAFTARLSKIAGKKAELTKGDETHALVASLKDQNFVIKQIEKKEQKRNPTPPFITSKLQQEASRKLGFTAKKTMMLAQRLYEGIEMGDVTEGLITYMRTDSLRVSDVALEQVREFIHGNYGPEYVPETPNIYKNKKGNTQDAHEAVRPTNMVHTPESVKKYLERDAYRLYDLIWKRFVASQMMPAVMDRTLFIIEAKDCEFRASGSVIKFPGFLSVYREDWDEGDAETQKLQDEEGRILPNLKEGEKLKVHEFVPSQHFTEPPPRYTEASLVKELEEKGIGRPSTYASILSVIQEKKYVDKMENKKFRPSDLGKLVNDLLVAHFPDILDVKFTAHMEEELDDVADGKMKWNDTIKEFYTTFSKTLAEAKVEMRNVKRQEILTEEKCEKCGGTMVIKFGKNGEFLACQAYPECKNSKEFVRNEAGKIEIQVEEKTDEVCEKCSRPMVVKRGKFGKFLACSGYPDCKSTKAISIGVNCPRCTKPLSSRRTKKGKIFFGCTGYPQCDFASWDKPVNEKCPQCGASFLVEKVTKTSGSSIKCVEKDCGYSRSMEETE